MRHTRGAMVETLGADYVRTARAKSVTERMVVLKHALRNALIPVVTLGAIEFGRLLSGAVLTEQIFAIPGFGKMLVTQGTGMALYTNPAGCSAACQSIWPPLVMPAGATTPTGAPCLATAKLGTKLSGAACCASSGEASSTWYEAGACSVR